MVPPYLPAFVTHTLPRSILELLEEMAAYGCWRIGAVQVTTYRG